MNHRTFRDPEWVGWPVAFGLIALWTLSGAVPGFFFPEWTYQSFHGRPAESAQVLDLFRGAWGQTLLFGLGYAFAAVDPVRHGAVALLGAIGKLMFAARLALTTAPADLTGFTLVALVGDVVLALLILVYALGTGQLATYFRRRGA